MPANVIIIGERILVDASQEFRGFQTRCLGDGPLYRISRKLLRCGRFFGVGPFWSICHDAAIDGRGLFFQAGGECGLFFRNVVLLTEIFGEVIQLDTTKSALFEFWDPGLLKVIQSTVLIPQSIGFGIGKFSVKHSRAKIHSAQLFLKIIAEDFFDLLHQTIGGFEVDWRFRSAGSKKCVVTDPHDHVCPSQPKQRLMPLEGIGTSERHTVKRSRRAPRSGRAVH